MIKIEPVEDRYSSKLTGEIRNNYKKLSGLWYKVILYILPFEKTELAEELYEIKEIMRSGLFDRRKNKTENLEKAYWRLVDLHLTVCGVSKNKKERMGCAVKTQRQRHHKE